MKAPPRWGFLFNSTMILTETSVIDSKLLASVNELGRQVFVVPANISATSFRGSHALIRAGATLVDHPDQVLYDLGIEPRPKEQQKAPVSGDQARILNVLSVDPMPTEQIARTTGFEPAKVMAELTMLELEGRVVRAPSGYALAP